MVSVIIPSYNHAKYLSQRIESVLDQTYDDFEVIILDDNSPDNSQNVIENYRSNPKIKKIIFNEFNSGSVFKQWQKGIDLAQGEYIWIAESDDFADKNFLSKLVPILDKDEKIGLVYCNSKIVYENKSKDDKFITLNDLRKYMFRNQQWESSFTMDGKEFLDKYLSRKCVINNASSVLFRKSSFTQVKVNIKDYRYAGDWVVYNAIAETAKISFLNDELSNYRKHVANASNKSKNNNVIFIENYKVFSNYYNFLKAENKSTVSFLFAVRRSLLQVLIESNERKQIYDQYRKINKKLIRDIMYFLPMVLVEEKTIKLVKYLKSYL